jgi:hypothetical protein
MKASGGGYAVSYATREVGETGCRSPRSFAPGRYWFPDARAGRALDS